MEIFGLWKVVLPVKTLYIALAIALLTASPAAATKIKDEADCTAKIDSVRELDDSIDVDPKFEIIVKELIGVLENLCDAKSFEDADDVAGAILGILKAGEPKDGPQKT